MRTLNAGQIMHATAFERQPHAVLDLSARDLLNGLIELSAVLARCASWRVFGVA